MTRLALRPALVALAALGSGLLIAPAAEAVPPELAEAERARIQAHLLRAEAKLARRDTRGLSPEARARRAKLAEALAAYRRAGRFPENLRGPDQQPMFIGDEGTRCAVAALLETTGEHALVEKIARERNLAYVPELADEPGLAAWLEANGLTLEEAAAIQPAYGYCASRAEAFCPTSREAAAIVARVELEDLEARTFRVTEVLVEHPEARTATVGAIIGVRTTFATPDELSEGLAVITDPTGQSRGYFVGLRDGRAYAAEDPCDVQVDLPLADALAVLVEPDCTDRLDARDPLWAGGFCVHGLGDNATVECPGDGDAGLADAAPLDASPPRDAGRAAPIARDADGCSSTGGAVAPLGLLALAALGRRRRGAHRGRTL